MHVNFIGKGPVFESIVLHDMFDQFSNCEYSTLIVNFPTEYPGDVLVCSGYSEIVRMFEVKAYPMGVINIHTSLLPKYRGRHPVDWAMEHREKEIGITIHYIQDETIDTGDVILQDSIQYHGEGYNKVMEEICCKVPHMLYVALHQIKHECVYRRKQNEEAATYYPKRTKPRIY